MKSLLLFTFILTAFAASDRLRIYQFEVGQGDSSLIIFPSGYSILIDLGEDNGDAKNAKYVAKRLKAIIGGTKVNVFVLTHYHTDHHGAVNKGGVWYLLEKEGFTFGKFVYRNAGVYKGSKLSDCNKDTISWKYVGKIGAYSMVCYATSQKDKTKLSKVAERADLCSKSQINPPDDQAEVEITMRDAYNVKMENGKKLNDNYRTTTNPPSENDYSICLRVQYGDFVYATCGDLSGYNWHKDGRDYVFHDVESSVAPMIGEVDAMKVNHHGSKTSTNEKWCATLKPTVAVITCGPKSSFPDTRVLNNLKNVNAKVYLTTDCNEERTAKYANTITFNKDVVIKYKLGDKTFTVSKPNGDNKATYNVKMNKPKREACKTLPA